MKKVLFYIILCLITTSALGQSWISGGTSQIYQGSGFTNVRISFAGIGITPMYTKGQVDSIITQTTVPYTAGYGLILNSHQFRADTSVLVNKTYFNTQLPSAIGNYYFRLGTPNQTVSQIPTFSNGFNSNGSISATTSGSIDLNANNAFVDIGGVVSIGGYSVNLYNSNSSIELGHFGDGSASAKNWLNSLQVYNQPTLSNDVTRKRDVDSLITSAVSGYLPLSGGTVTGQLSVATTGSDRTGLFWTAFTDYGNIYFNSTGDSNNSSQLVFETGDNGNDSVGTQEGFLFLKNDQVLGRYELLRLNRTQFQFRGNDITLNVKVATYAAMLALSPMPVMMQVRVVADENKALSNTIYQIWPDGKRVWIAATDDN